MSGRRGNSNGGPSSSWRIVRFELIYFNARHRRWQYFAEDPRVTFDEVGNHRDGESPHRRQIRRLLFMVREAFKHLLARQGTPVFQLAAPSGTCSADGEIEIRSPSVPVWPTLGKAYLDYLSDVAEFGERLKEEDRVALGQCFDQLRHSGQARLGRNLSLTLLSLLPIFETWDTWGCFIRASRAYRGCREMKFPAYRQDQPWSEPFYLAELFFRGYPTRSVSSRVLGQDVVLTPGWCDLGVSAHPSFLSPGDFFDYCRQPFGKEKHLYQLYGHFVDTLITGLAAQERAQRLYFLAYPIRAAGRFHFLQIVVTRDDNATVQDLWSDWKTLHSEFWSAETKRMLDAEQERIAVSAFQYAAAAALREHLRKEHALDDDDVLKRVLAEHIYGLFPISDVRVNGREWRHRRYEYYPTTDAGVPGYEMGLRWTSGDPSGRSSKRGVPFVSHKHGISGTVEPQHVGRLHAELFPHRVVQSVEQQMDHLKDTRNSLREERRRSDINSRRADGILRAYLADLNVEDIASITNATTERDIAELLRRPVPESIGSSAHHFRTVQELVYQAYPHEKDYLTRLQERVVPSLLLRLSEYFETGPAKIVSHATHENYFGGSLADLRTATETYYSRLADKISRDLDAFGGSLRADFEKFHNDVLAKVSAAKTLRDLEGHLDIMKAHRLLRREELRLFDVTLASKGDECGFRTFVVTPLDLLAKFFEVLRTSAQDYHDGFYTRRLRGEDYRFEHRWPPTHGEEYPVVRLVEHFFCFPMRNSVDLQRLAGGELGEVWRSCEVLASLLIQRAGEAYLISKKEPCRTRMFQKRLEEDGIPRTLSQYDSEACLIVALQTWRMIETAGQDELWRQDVRKAISLQGSEA